MVLFLKYYKQADLLKNCSLFVKFQSSNKHFSLVISVRKICVKFYVYVYNNFVKVLVNLTFKEPIKMLPNVIFTKNLVVNDLPEKAPLPFTIMKRRNELSNEVVKVITYVRQCIITFCYPLDNIISDIALYLICNIANKMR